MGIFQTKEESNATYLRFRSMWRLKISCSFVKKIGWRNQCVERSFEVIFERCYCSSFRWRFWEFSVVDWKWLRQKIVMKKGLQYCKINLPINLDASQIRGFQSKGLRGILLIHHLVVLRDDASLIFHRVTEKETNVSDCVG